MLTLLLASLAGPGEPIQMQDVGVVAAARDELVARVTYALARDGRPDPLVLSTAETTTFVVDVVTYFQPIGHPRFAGEITGTVTVEVRDHRFRLTAGPFVHHGDRRSFGVLTDGEDPGPDACTPACPNTQRRVKLWAMAGDVAGGLALDYRERMKRIAFPIVGGTTDW